MPEQIEPPRVILSNCKGNPVVIIAIINADGIDMGGLFSKVTDWWKKRKK